MEEINVNYFHKAHSAWLKHCAQLVKPCSKTVDEVVTYLLESYDLEPMNQEELESVKEFYAQGLEGERFSELSDGNVNKLALKEIDTKFTETALHDSQEALRQVERVERADIFLKGYRILLTERNKQRLREYVTYTHIDMDGMYEGYERGYVFWDETLRHFGAEEYGSLEILDDIRIYRGVTQEDIDNLTYRFSRFVQLFPHSGYSLSYTEFINDMNMCMRYGFYNHQRLFTDMLKKNKIQYEFFGEHVADGCKKRWYESFVPQSLRVYSDKHHYLGEGGFLWHIFSYGDMDCLEEEQGISAFNAQQKDECIIFFSYEKYAYKIKNASNLSAEIVNEFSEVFITDEKFSWTYIHTHESSCGPYFYKKGAAHEKELIKEIMKRPVMHVGSYRLDYLWAYLNGLRLSVHKSYPFEGSWDLEHDMEKWLLINESVSIRSAMSINAWSLFFRTFGARGLAVNAFQCFLTDDLLTEFSGGYPKINPAWEIFKFRSQLGDSPPDLTSVKDENEKFAPMVNIIRGLIEERSEEIKIYLYYEYYFMQIRFYFKKGERWIDGNTFKGKENYYNKLVALHAYAELFFEKNYLLKEITISYKNGEIDFKLRPSNGKDYKGKERLEPDIYENGEYYFNMIFKWQSGLRESNLDLEKFSKAVDSVDWKAFCGPEYYEPDKLAQVLKKLSIVDTADLNHSIAIESGKIPTLLQNDKICSEVLCSVGNNHAGTYYPAVIKAVDFIIQVALEGNNAISRRCALEVLTDLLNFCPETGSYKEYSAEEIKAIVNEKICGIKPQLQALATQ